MDGSALEPERSRHLRDAEVVDGIRPAAQHTGGDGNDEAVGEVARQERRDDRSAAFDQHGPDAVVMEGGERGFEVDAERASGDHVDGRAELPQRGASFGG